MKNIGLRTAEAVGDAAPYSSEAPAIRTLEQHGFVEPFTVKADGLRISGRDQEFRPEELRIRDYFRFEGTSDPGDMSVIYALEAPDGTRGYLVDAFGAYADPRISAIVHRIPTDQPSASSSPHWVRWTAIALGSLVIALVGLRLGSSRCRS